MRRSRKHRHELMLEAGISAARSSCRSPKLARGRSPTARLHGKAATRWRPPAERWHPDLRGGCRQGDRHLQRGVEGRKAPSADTRPALRRAPPRQWRGQTAPSSPARTRSARGVRNRARLAIRPAGCAPRQSPRPRALTTPAASTPPRSRPVAGVSQPVSCRSSTRPGSPARPRLEDTRPPVSATLSVAPGPSRRGRGPVRRPSVAPPPPGRRPPAPGSPPSEPAHHRHAVRRSVVGARRAPRAARRPASSTLSSSFAITASSRSSSSAIFSPTRRQRPATPRRWQVTRTAARSAAPERFPPARPRRRQPARATPPFTNRTSPRPRPPGSSCRAGR